MVWSNNGSVDSDEDGTVVVDISLEDEVILKELVDMIWFTLFIAWHVLLFRQLNGLFSYTVVWLPFFLFCLLSVPRLPLISHIYATFLSFSTLTDFVFPQSPSTYIFLSYKKLFSWSLSIYLIILFLKLFEPIFHLLVFFISVPEKLLEIGH